MSAHRFSPSAYSAELRSSPPRNLMGMRWHVPNGSRGSLSEPPEGSKTELPEMESSSGLVPFQSGCG